MLPELQHILKPRPRKYRNIIKHLSPLVLFVDRDYSLTTEDIFKDLSSSRGTRYFLGFYSKKGIEHVYQKFGIFRGLKKQGLFPSRIRIDTADPYKHILRIVHDINKIEYLSTEAVLRQGGFPFPKLRENEGTKKKESRLDLLVVEWLLLQNPCKSFSKRRPQLPGQGFPGLGMSELAFELLYWTAWRMRLDGILMIPNYLHTGLFYGRQFLFINPHEQGQLQALENTLSLKIRIDQLTWACAEGQLIETKTNEVFHWTPAPMVLPISKRLKDYFYQKEYNRLMKETKNSHNFRINKGYKKIYNPDWMSS